MKLSALYLTISLARLYKDQNGQKHTFLGRRIRKWYLNDIYLRDGAGPRSQAM